MQDRRKGLWVMLFAATALINSAASRASDTSAELISQSPAGLAAALRATVTLNPAVKGKQAELNAQHYVVDSAKAGRLPTLSAQANNLDDEYNQSSLRVDQPLWTFGKIDTAIEQAQADVVVEQQGVLQVQRELLEQTAVAYARSTGIRQRIDVAQSNIDEHQRLYQRIERRHAGQLASEADVRFAYSRLIQARAQLERIKGELQVALTDLQALTQVVVVSNIDVDPALVELPASQDIKSRALQNSADVRLKQERLQSVRLDIEREKASILPTLYLRAERDLGDGRNNNDRNRAGLVIESNFEGLGLVSKGRVKGAEARLEATQQDLEVALNEVRRRTSSLLLDRRVQQGLIVSQSDVVEAVAATMESFLRQYETGRKSWVEVLNTQRELTELRLQLAQIKNDWLILSLRLASIIGTLDSLAGIKHYDDY